VKYLEAACWFITHDQDHAETILSIHK